MANFLRAINSVEFLTFSPLNTRLHPVSRKRLMAWVFSCSTAVKRSKSQHAKTYLKRNNHLKQQEKIILPSS